MKYQVLEHTADLKIKVLGKTKEELFSNALFAMAKEMNPETEGDKRTERKVEIESADLSALLVDFLSEALYSSQVNKEAYFEVRFDKFSDKEIKATLLGQKVKRFGEDIKAVTHHDLTIQEKEEGWEAIILFDI